MQIFILTHMNTESLFMSVLPGMFFVVCFSSDLSLTVLMRKHRSQNSQSVNNFSKHQVNYITEQCFLDRVAEVK